MRAGPGWMIAMAMATWVAYPLAYPYTMPLPHDPVLGDRVPPGAQGGIDSRYTPSPNFMGPIPKGGGVILFQNPQLDNIRGNIIYIAIQGISYIIMIAGQGARSSPQVRHIEDNKGDD